MTHFALTTAIASLAIFAGFVILSHHRFGLKGSYSAYAAKWMNAVRIHNANVWSIVTVITALLIVPSCIERGACNPLQFLGFVMPLYLCVVAFTPRWETIGGERKTHVIGALACALTALLWMILVCKAWYIPVIAFVAFATLAFVTKSVKKSYVFWLEMTMFASTWATIFIR